MMHSGHDTQESSRVGEHPSDDAKRPSGVPGASGSPSVAVVLLATAVLILSVILGLYLPTQLVFATLADFVMPVVGTTIAMFLLGICIWILRKHGVAVPLDPVSLWERFWSVDQGRSSSAKPLGVSVECRDSCGTRLNFGPLVPIRAHSGANAVYVARDGVFVGCDPNHIGVGSSMSLAIGTYNCVARVKFDPDQTTLFVATPIPKLDIVRVMNGCGP